MPESASDSMSHPGTRPLAAFLALGLRAVLPWIAVAVLIAAGVGLAVHLARLRGPIDRSGDPVGGDFVCFFPAARMIATGDGASIYDPVRQRELQQQILGPDPTRFGAYQYPPSLALALAPLALLPMHAAYGIYTILQVAAAIAAVRVLRAEIPSLQRSFWIVLAAMASFSPLFVAMTTGQNAATSMLLLALLYRALRRERDVAAGVWIGVLAYKPQLALLVGLVLLINRRWRVVAAAVGVGLIHYALGALVVGGDWPVRMLEAIHTYWPYERLYNGTQAISLVALCEHLSDQSWSKPLGAALALLVAWVCAQRWRATEPAAPQFAVTFAATIAATLVISPHTQWYDAGLLSLSAILLIDWRLRASGSLNILECLILVACLALPAANWLRDGLGVHPAAALPLVFLAWCAAFDLERRFPIRSRRSGRTAAAGGAQ